MAKYQVTQLLEAYSTSTYRLNEEEEQCLKTSGLNLYSKLDFQLQGATKTTCEGAEESKTI